MRDVQSEFTLADEGLIEWMSLLSSTVINVKIMWSNRILTIEPEHIKVIFPLHIGHVRRKITKYRLFLQRTSLLMSRVRRFILASLSRTDVPRRH